MGKRKCEKKKIILKEDNEEKEKNHRFGKEDTKT